MLPPKMPLWQKDYFEKKETENQQKQEKFFYSPIICLKARHKLPFEEDAPPCTNEGRVTFTEDGVDTNMICKTLFTKIALIFH